MTIRPPAPRASEHTPQKEDQGMTPVHLKLIFGFLATLVTLAFLLAVFLLTREGASTQALVSLFTAACGGGGLFWLLERLGR